ncbi:MAG: hypothetical protein IJ361_04250 [Spirochaetaceae bacterium]|nr:hypothetical protein [Spirochaetaceae bacterium]
MSISLGKLKEVNIREVWQHEQYDFSKWLSLPENIQELSDTLCNDFTSGLPVEIEARQKQYEYYRDKLLNFKRMGE